MPKDFMTINPVAARKLAERGSGPLVARATETVAMHARILAPGSMKTKIRVVVSPTAGGLGMVISEHPATTFVLYGTKAHPISAKPGGVLRFKWKGKIWYLRHVWHPEVKPNNFLEKALLASRV